jgi:hypothetical protein
VKGLEEPIPLVVEVEEGARLMELDDEVLSDADMRLLFDSLLEPNFLKNEGILVDAGDNDDSRVMVAILFVGAGLKWCLLSRQARITSKQRIWRTPQCLES